MRSYEFVSEKAVSKKQQQFFGIVRAMQKGDMKKGGEAGEVAKDMKVSDVKDFAKTKHKGLPTKKKSEGYANDQREKTQRQLAAHEKAMVKSAKKSINKYENFDDDEEVEYYNEINPVVIKAWKSVYPDVPLKAIDNEDMYMQYTTADEYELHGGNGKDFYLSLGVQYIGYEEPPMGYVNVSDAYAGNYKGVIAKIIAALFEWLEKQHPNMKVRELGIHMNRNAEAWDAIAQKVGAQIEKRGYYENFADRMKKKTQDQLAAHDKAMIKSARKSIEKYEKNKNKNEEAAGVGIVTKQNATADVPVGGEYMNVKKLFPKNKKKKTKEDNVQELVVKQQRPKIDVIYNIADRKDNSPFPLSYKDTGGASSGGMVYITPENAKKFVQFYERRAKDEQQLMLQALKSVSGLKNLFTNIGLEIAKIETKKEENYEREDLPQIKNKHLEHIRHTVETVEIGDIVPVQNEFIFENFKKQVDKISEGSYAPIIVDCNNKIINGHHRYAALQMLGETNVKVAKLFLTVNAVVENFADGKKKGKSRPGRVKKSGASCNGSVTSLRKKAKNAGGEKGRMYHWCANMKSGRKKG